MTRVPGVQFELDGIKRVVLEIADVLVIWQCVVLRLPTYFENGILSQKLYNPEAVLLYTRRDMLIAHCQFLNASIMAICLFLIAKIPNCELLILHDIVQSP